MTSVHLLLNPARRRRPVVNGEIRTAIEAHGHDVTDLNPPDVASIADTIRQAAAADGMTRLIIAGGDGLVHQALPAVANTDIAVGIVGVGTGNDFARAAGLPRKPRSAVAVALQDPVPVDLIETDDGRYAASVITGGFSGQVNARANQLRVPRGQQRYTVATLLELRRLRPFTLQVTVDGVTHTESCTFFAIANTCYFGGGMAICPDADPRDGLLDLTVVGATSPFVLARMLPTVFSGRHVRHPAVTTFRGKRIEIDADVDLWADGEPFAGDRFQAASGALALASTLEPA